MKTKIILIGSAIFSYAYLHISPTRAETLPPIIISGIQISGTKADDEFIRLGNETDSAIDLAGFRLAKKSLSGGICKENPLVSAKHFQGIILPKSSFLISHPAYKAFYDADLDYSGASYYLADNTIVLLYDKTGDLLDQKTIGDGCDGSAPPADPPIVPPAPDPSTPPPVIPKPTAPVSVRLNEIFPNPAAKGDAGEFIELYNSGIEPADISGWTLRDATKTGKYIFPPGTIIAATAYLAVTDQSFKLSLNNSNETVTLFDNTDVIIDSVRYAKTKEDVSLNYTAIGWRGGTPTPGTANLLNNLPETREKIPKKGYEGIAVIFSATGKDADKQELKYTWDFGDGHKSYKAETSHTYEENGTYVITLTITDGVEDSVETFAIEIRSYKPPEVRITSLMPNPGGKDTDNEWIIIENREKKTINLKDFGIATGWKNIVNHPIREDFLIEPEKSAKLTRTLSLFTLPNQKGKIELRAPDGRVLQAIRYKLEKSAAENSVYSKEKGQRWKWQARKSEEKESLSVSSTYANGTVLREEELPEEEPAPIEEDADKKVLGETISQADTDETFIRLLNYGTRVKIPDGIALAFDDTVSDMAPPVPREHYAVSFAKASFSELNSALNELLSSAR